jgi:transcriptional regulator with XRE-family HTH domain
LTEHTVHPRLTVVNTLRTVSTEKGRRLRQFIEARWGRGRGGMRGLCEASGITPETLYAWFRGDNEPSLGLLAQLAEALGVSRWEIVAAMDGEIAARPGDPRLEAYVRSLVDRELAARGLPPPAAEPPSRAKP